MTDRGSFMTDRGSFMTDRGSFMTDRGSPSLVMAFSQIRSFCPKLIWRPAYVTKLLRELQSCI